MAMISALTTSISIVLEVLVSAIRQEKELKNIKFEKNDCLQRKSLEI